MTTTMKVIKNGVEEEREVDHYNYEYLYDFPCSAKPVLKYNEHCTYTMEGKCYIYETIEDN